MRSGSGVRFSEGMRGEMELAAARTSPILYIPGIPLSGADIKSGRRTRRFSEADCIPGSNKMDYTNQILVLKPEAYGGNAEITADDSLWLAEHGNGCRYGARGLMVMAVHAVRQTGPLGAAGLFSASSAPTAFWSGRRISPSATTGRRKSSIWQSRSFPCRRRKMI